MLSSFFIGWLSLFPSLLSMEDIDPKAFDFDPKAHEQTRQNADYAAVQFLAKLLYQNEPTDSAVAMEEESDDTIQETVDLDPYLYIPGVVYQNGGKTKEYDKPLSVMIQEGNREVITHFPQQAILSPYERGEYTGEDLAFYISRKPITNREWAKFIKATSRNAPAYWPKDKLSAAFKEEPVVNITHEEAESYATWAKRRLPTYGEYKRAEQLFSSLRRNAPLREWTATAAKNGPGSWLVIGGGELQGSYRDQQTGFRVAHEGE